MMDLSDGLATDLAAPVRRERRRRASSQLDALPIAAAHAAWPPPSDRDALAWATGGGEDYELLVVCAADAFHASGRRASRRRRAPRSPASATIERGERRAVRRRAAAARSRSRAASSTSSRDAMSVNGIVLELLVLGFLVACSALLTGAEAAYFSLGRSRLKRVQAEGASAPAPLIERPHDLLVTLLIGITVINIGASAIAATMAVQIFGERFGLLAEVIGMILVLTTFGEVLPMTVAVKYPEQFLRVVRRPVSWLGAVAAPAPRAARRVHHADRQDGRRRQGRAAGAVRGGAAHAGRRGRERGRGGARRARDDPQGLRARGHAGALGDGAAHGHVLPRRGRRPSREILPALRENLHSRVPVYEGSIDVIVGVLYTKDLLPYVATGLPADFDLRAHLHPPYFVPESKRADALLQEFQAKRLHMAIVVDEYGGTAGLVSLEDLLEELVGEIADEYDEPERLIQRVDETTYPGGREAARSTSSTPSPGLSISNQDYETVGGWVLDLFGRVPRKAERVETPDVVVTVEKIERTRIVEVLIALRKPAPSQAAA